MKKIRTGQKVSEKCSWPAPRAGPLVVFLCFQERQIKIAEY